MRGKLIKQYSIVLTAILLLVGCVRKSHSLASQVLRADGLLNVVAKSDDQGSISSAAGENPHVTISFGGTNTVVIGQTQITMRDKLWGDIPEITKAVLVEFYDNEFQIELDPDR
jgi:hypothetical protein